MAKDLNKDARYSLTADALSLPTTNCVLCGSSLEPTIDHVIPKSLKACSAKSRLKVCPLENSRYANHISRSVRCRSPEGGSRCPLEAPTINKVRMCRSCNSNKGDSPLELPTGVGRSLMFFQEPRGGISLMATMGNIKMTGGPLSGREIVDSTAIMANLDLFAKSYDPNDVSSVINRYWRVVQVEIEENNNVRLVHQLPENSDWLAGPFVIHLTVDNSKKCDLARKLLDGKVVFYKLIGGDIDGKLVLGQRTWDRPM